MCSVVSCDSRRRRARRFAPPADPEKRLEWVQFLFEVNGQRLRESSWTDIRVCSEHFTRGCFLSESPAAQLKPEAVPSLCEAVHESNKVTIQPKEEPCELKICHSQNPGSSALKKEETSTLISCTECPPSLEVTESSESDYRRMLQKIENLDIIKEKVSLLQMNKGYVVNEKQLLQLFSAKCPVCKSTVRTEKVVRGVLVVLNQQCLHCGYSKHWRNLNKVSLKASDDHLTECTEISLETVSTKTVGITEIVQTVDEKGNLTEETDDSSCPDEVRDSDDNWDPEDDPLILESEDEGSSFEEVLDDAIFRHRELCTDCGIFFEIRKPHVCEYKMKPFSCNICGKRCVSDHSLAIHSRIHSIDYQHPCKYCNIEFKTKIDKITHERVHLVQSTPYKCLDCCETFATYKERKDHLESHTERRQLKCSICGIQFVSALALQRHSVVHTGEKPFRCSVCQRGFNQSGHLKSHMRLHTGERPYTCKHCNESFNHNVSLKSHVHRYHTASGHRQNTTNPKVFAGSDPLDDGVADSEVVKIEGEQVAENEVRTEKSTFKRKTTGRTIGRPKKNLMAAVTEEQQGPTQGTNCKINKVGKRKKRLPSIEGLEGKLSESEESLDLMEAEENEKVRSRHKAVDVAFNLTEIKSKRESSRVIKSSRIPRGKL